MVGVRHCVALLHGLWTSGGIMSVLAEHVLGVFWPLPASEYILQL